MTSVEIKHPMLLERNLLIILERRVFFNLPWIPVIRFVSYGLVFL
jgi:hypothetical protein